MTTQQSQLTPDMFKQQVLKANPNAVASDGKRYADIPSSELLQRFISVNPDAKTKAGVPYSSYLGSGQKDSPVKILDNTQKQNLKQIGTDFSQHQQDAKNIDDNPKLNIGGKILGNISNAASGMNDLIGDSLKFLGIDKIIGSLPAIDIKTNKLTTLDKALPSGIDVIKKSANQVKAVQDLSTSIESFMNNHPNDAEGVKAVLNSFGTLLNAAGIADLMGAGAKDVASNAVKEDAVASVPANEKVVPDGIPPGGTPPDVGEISFSPKEQFATTAKGSQMSQMEILQNGNPVGNVILHESPDGFEVTDVKVNQGNQTQGIGTKTYENINQQSIDSTGNPLKSSKYLTNDGQKLWDGLVSDGKAVKSEDGSYKMKNPNDYDSNKLESKNIETDSTRKTGIRAAVTPIKDDVKTSAKKILESFKGDTEKAKKFVSDLFSQAKSKSGDVSEDTAAVKLANKQLPEAKKIVYQNLIDAAKAKTAALAKYGNAVTEDAGSIVENIENRISEQFGSTGEKLDNLRLSDTLINFSTQLRDTLETNTAKAWDKFVDTWQDKVYNNMSLKSSELGAFMREFVTGGESDINKMVKDTMDQAEGANPGEGEYTTANDKYHSNAQARGDLKDNMGTLYKSTGKYSGAANFYTKAAGGDSQSLEALRNIESVTGIPITQSANLAKFAQLASQSVSLSKIIPDAIPALIGIFGGKRTLYYDLISYMGDPEGAIFNQIDSAGKEKISGVINQVGQEIQKSPELVNQLKQGNMDTAQGAVMLMLGELANQTSRKSSQ